MSDLTLHQKGKFLSYFISGFSITISLFSGLSLLWAIPTTIMIGFGSYYGMKYLYRHLNSIDPRNEQPTLDFNYDIDFGDGYYGINSRDGVRVRSINNNFSEFYPYITKFEVIEYKNNYPVPVLNNSDMKFPRLSDAITDINNFTDDDIILIEQIEFELNNNGYSLKGKNNLTLIGINDIGVMYESIPFKKTQPYERNILDIYADIYLDISKYEEDLRLNKIKSQAETDIGRIYYG